MWNWCPIFPLPRELLVWLHQWCTSNGPGGRSCSSQISIPGNCSLKLQMLWALEQMREASWRCSTSWEKAGEGEHNQKECANYRSLCCDLIVGMEAVRLWVTNSWRVVALTLQYLYYTDSVLEYSTVFYPNLQYSIISNWITNHLGHLSACRITTAWGGRQM
jgi:hypothetical protein